MQDPKQQKIKINKTGKIVLYVGLYWLIFVILPYIFAQSRGWQLGIFWHLIIYVLLIAPFLFIIPYKLIKLKTKKGKIVLILFGLILPYLFIYLLYME